MAAKRLAKVGKRALPRHRERIMSELRELTNAELDLVAGGIIKTSGCCERVCEPKCEERVVCDTRQICEPTKVELRA
jgi:hypothetical protein